MGMSSWKGVVILQTIFGRSAEEGVVTGTPCRWDQRKEATSASSLSIPLAKPFSRSVPSSTALENKR